MKFLQITRKGEPGTGNEIVRRAFAELSKNRQEEIMHAIGICTDEVNCPLEEN